MKQDIFNAQVKTAVHACLYLLDPETECSGEAAAQCIIYSASKLYTKVTDRVKFVEAVQQGVFEVVSESVEPEVLDLIHKATDGRYRS